MTSNEDHTFPYYRSPSSIRNETFPRRMRGLDEYEVREYLDLLADQVQAADLERQEYRAENERLQGELQQSRADNERLQAELERVRTELAEYEEVGDRVNDQVVELFSQAQLIAEEMVEDVSQGARERLTQARAQERQILEEAMQTAEQTRRDAEALIRWTVPGVGVGEPSNTAAEMSAAAAELEQVRSFARAAQAQMQSIMDSFATEVGRLADTAPALDAGGPASADPESASLDTAGWRVAAPRRSNQGPRHSA